MAQAFKWTSEELQDMVTSYKQGESAQSIAKRYGTSYQVIQPALTKQGVTLRSKREANKRQTCDERFFQVIDTEEKAYWLGFITADGCVSNGKKTGHSPRIGINLGIQDCEHLVKFKQVLQATQMVSRNERSCSFTVFSEDMAADLAMHGILPKKTFSTKPAQVLPELARHYWRGIIDGDGYISKNKKQLILVGDYEVVLGFQTFVLTHCPKTKACISRMENIYTFQLHGIILTRRMLDVLYEGATVYLKRKYESTFP
jgi:hypothetical protein